ncbi:MAG: tetratricopeptide repeat protein [Alphaproteobacteria bacterium]
MQDLFALYDGISKVIALAMHVHLTIGERGKSWVKAVGATETFRLRVLGRSRLNSSTAAGLKEAEDLFLESHKREPDNALANLMLASVHIQKLMMGLSTDPLSDLAKAQSFVDKAQSVMESGIGFSLVATLKLFATGHSAALAQAEHAIELDPTGSETIALAGTVKTFCGKVPHAIVFLRRAMRLQPYHPIWMPAMLGFAHLQLGENEAAEQIFESIMSTANVDGFFYRLALSNISAIAVFEGDMDKAREYLARVLKKNPTGNAYHVAQQLYFLKDQEFVQRYVAALRKAGLPEY